MQLVLYREYTKHVFMLHARNLLIWRFILLNSIYSACWMQILLKFPLPIKINQTNETRQTPPPPPPPKKKQNPDTYLLLVIRSSFSCFLRGSVHVYTPFTPPFLITLHWHINFTSALGNIQRTKQTVASKESSKRYSGKWEK